MRESASLLTLLDEKVHLLVKECERMWNEGSDIKVSSSEWRVLSRIASERLSVSEVARRAGVTRQAAHKYICALREKGLVSLTRLPGNNRSLFVELTSFGKDCVLTCGQLECELEKRIERAVGTERIQELKAALGREWLSE